MGWHPRTFPQCWKTEGHTRGTRACRKLEYAASESATNEYYTDNQEWDSPASNEEWDYIVGPTYLRRAVRRRKETATAENEEETREAERSAAKGRPGASRSATEAAAGE